MSTFFFINCRQFSNIYKIILHNKLIIYNVILLFFNILFYNLFDYVCRKWKKRWSPWSTFASWVRVYTKKLVKLKPATFFFKVYLSGSFRKWSFHWFNNLCLLLFLNRIIKFYYIFMENPCMQRSYYCKMDIRQLFWLDSPLCMYGERVKGGFFT